MVPGMDAAVWEALGTWVTALVAVGAAIVAWHQVGEARRLRLEQAQPQVVAYLEMDETPASIDLVVKNFGTTTAFDVRLSVTPPLRRSTGGVAPIELPDLIPTLVPGQQWRTWFDAGRARYQSEELSDEERYAATVTYRDASKRKYSSESTLDFAQYKPIMYADRKTMTDLVQSVRELTATVKTFKEAQGGGVSVYVRDGAFKDDERRRYWEERRTQSMRSARSDGDGPGPDSG